MSKPDVRETVLSIVVEMAAGENSVASDTALQTARTRLGAGDLETQRAILDAWHDLYRNGLISWGVDLQSSGANSSPAWAHLTPLGLRTAEQVSRDPSNPRGYLAHLDKLLPVGTIARSYVEEAVRTYGASCDKATAVLIGAASETLVIELQTALVARITELGKSVPSKLKANKLKTIAEGIADTLRTANPSAPDNLLERFDSYWAPFVGYLRIARNDAGHPKSVQPVTRETVHAMLLVFPEQVALAVGLTGWVAKSYSVA